MSCETHLLACVFPIQVTELPSILFYFEGNILRQTTGVCLPPLFVPLCIFPLQWRLPFCPHFRQPTDYLAENHGTNVCWTNIKRNPQDWLTSEVLQWGFKVTSSQNLVRLPSRLSILTPADLRKQVSTYELKACHGSWKMINNHWIIEYLKKLWMAGRDGVRKKILKSLADIIRELLARVFSNANGAFACLSSDESLEHDEFWKFWCKVCTCD